MDSKKITYTGLMMALVFLVTSYSFKMVIPLGAGYIHLGDSMIFVAVVVLGWRYGAVAAGIGSMLADILGGFAIYAIPTLIIKTLMAIIMGIALNSKSKKSTITLASLTGIVWVAFILLFKFILTDQLPKATPDILPELGLSNMSELQAMGNNTQNVMIISAISLVVILGLICSIMLKKVKMLNLNLIIGMIASGLWMIIGYTFATYILYRNYISAIFAIPFNVLQFILGFIIAMLIVLQLRRAKIIEG